MKRFALSVTLLALLAIGPVYAAEFFCRSGDVSCLIAAINAANQNFEENTINLEAGTYSLTAADNEDSGEFGGNGLPLITTSRGITIRGQGSSLTTIERDSALGFSEPLFRIFRIEAAGNLTLEALAVKNGVGDRLGGGNLLNFGNLTILESDIAEGFTNPSVGAQGGGINNVGTLVIRASRIFDNIGSLGAGIRNNGIATIEDSFIFLNINPDLEGGGIFNGGELTISRSNLVNNAAVSGGGLANFGTANLDRVFIWLNRATNQRPPLKDRGGGIYNQGGQLRIDSSTIAENTSEREGAGISNFSGSTTVTNTTIVANSSGSHLSGGIGGGISNQDQLEIQNSIVALNTAFEPLTSATQASDCSGSPLSLGRNIIGDTSGCQIILRQSDFTGDPGLEELVVEDPPGRGYYPLLANSPAINAGNPDACPQTDQLGLPRVGTCDIGSVEFQGRMVVSVDIRPKKDANRINPASDKNVNVAIFSSSGFDATKVDADSVHFGATGTEASPNHVALNDANGDGLRDMVFRFEIQDLGIKCGDTSAVLTGQITNGPSIIGSSPLTTVQCKQQVAGGTPIK